MQEAERAIVLRVLRAKARSLPTRKGPHELAHGVECWRLIAALYAAIDQLDPGGLKAEDREFLERQRARY